MKKLLLLLLSIISTIAFADLDKSQKIQKITNSYIVKFKGDKNNNSPVIWPAKSLSNLERGFENIEKFGKHSSGQDKFELEKSLNLIGSIEAIYDGLNAIHVRIDEEEAARLLKNPLVEWVQQEAISTTFASQTPVGWGLGRIDEPTVVSNSSYNYTMTGSGQAIVVLDTGLKVGTASVIGEFGARAQILGDYNSGGTGNDCNGHGTFVSSIAGGNTFGVAKNVTIWMVKITTDCTASAPETNLISAFNWLATNAPIGTIINWSGGFQNDDFSCTPYYDLAVEAAVKNAYQNGMIVVVAAGNDACSANNFTPARMTEVFTVGATTSNRLSVSQDAKWSSSRAGSAISGFAPGALVDGMDLSGAVTYKSGTSYAAPYVAGIFALACQSIMSAPVNCNNSLATSTKYNALINTALTGTVVNTSGTPFTDGTNSRFIVQRW